MASCTFFGHSEINSEHITKNLLCVLEKFIVNNGVDTFYVGNQGDFDRYALSVLRKLKKKFSSIQFFVVLAYHPAVKAYSDFIAPEETIFPEELDTCHPRFAVSKRNLWMISKSDYAVVFVKHPTGGAAKHKEIAEKKGLTVINICN